MKKTILKYLLILVLAVSLVFTLASCDILNSILPEGILPGGEKPDPENPDPENPDPENPDPDQPGDGEIPDISGVVFADKTVTYNGDYQELSIDRSQLPAGISVMYSTNKYINAGEYSITADFYYAGSKIEGASKTATLTIEKASYDVSGVSLLGLTKIYDGEEVSVSATGKLPAGVTISYVINDAEGNTVEQMVNAGVYTVWATFNGDEANYHPVTPISASVEIRKQTVSGLSFSDAAFDYDATAKSIYVSGTLPEGVTVVYDGNAQTEVGSYAVTAIFTVNGNFEPIADMTATMTISKKSHDMSGITLLGKTVTYTGEAQAIAIEGTLPEGVSVEYVITDAEGNAVSEIISVGSYTVTAKFTGDPVYEAIEDMTATVVVNKATVPALQFSDAQFAYDGEVKSVAVVGTLPEGVSVEYVITDAEGNAVAEIVNYGSYTVTAKFTVSGNYEAIEDMTVTVTVIRQVYDMSGVSLPSTTVTYDGTDKTPALVGTLPEGVSAEISIVDANGNAVNSIINAGTYTVTAKFTGANAYAAPIESMSATVVVNKMTVSGIQFADTTFSYDGAEKSIYVTGLPSYVEVKYTGNGKSAPGSYTVTATFITDDNVEPIAPMTAILTIEVGNPLDTPTATLTYEKVTGGYAVSGITDGTTIVVIPASYDGQPVVTIKSNAFRDMKLEYVYIPETVTQIGNAAFYGNDTLTTVVLADFSVTVDSDGKLNTVGSSQLKTIGQKAFAETGIRSIDIPDSVTAIGYGAFAGCNRMAKMTLPFIGGSAATSHAYLGYLFGAPAAEASYNYVPPALKEIIVSANCKEIPARAFMNLSDIEKIYVGRSVTKIGINAFLGCTGLSDIYLPTSVVSIPAEASMSASPFWGCSDDLMVVIETSDTSGNYGKYYASISESAVALVVFNKTYEDYIMNKDSYRVADPADSTAAGIYVGGAIVDGFNPAVLEYSMTVDINKGYGLVSAIATSSSASVEITQVTAGVATVVITSANGESVTTYTISFTVTGTFESSSTVVNKNGASGTVSFVIDDGYEAAGKFAKSMLAKYPNLALNFAIYTKKFATLSTQDTNGDGIKEYVFDENGNYVYTQNTSTVDFWRDILTSAPGRAEILPHSNEHGFWGMNDEGGTQVTVSNRDPYNAGSSDSLIQGGSTAQIWAAQQIVEGIFGDLGSFGLTYVTPGIVKCTGEKAIGNDFTLKFSDSPVWLVNDTAVSSAGGVITLNSDTEISLQSVNVVVPAGTKITTIVEFENNVIPAGSIVCITSGSVVIPAGTVVQGYGAFYDALYEVAYDEGIMIAARNTGASGTSTKGYYTKDYFTTKAHRLLQRSFGISVTSSTTEATVDGWVSHIDNAVAKGVWVSYCIHNILSLEAASGNYILEEHAERLFSHAASYGDELWIANYTDATKYYHEWSSAVVTDSYDAASGTITVSLTDSERDDIYDMALTVKVTVPATWRTATVGDQTLEVRTAENGSTFVYVDIVPETTVVLSGN